MAGRHRNFRSNLVRSGRKTFWFSGLAIQDQITAASTAVLQASLNAAALALRPFTIVRTRGYVAIGSDQVGATEDQTLSYGHIVVSDQAVAIGVTALPTPVTDSQSDWFVYEALVGRFNFVTASGFEQAAITIKEIDSKAMRKVEEGQDLISVVETSALSSGLLVTAFFRTLIKLH